MKTKVKLINWGIASRIGNTIYINRNIKRRPELYQAILKHEQEHSEGFNSKDVAIDLFGKHLQGVKKEYYSFILSNPSSLLQFLPFGIYDKVIVWDPLMIVFWITVFAIFYFALI